jgi:hypothetical protein
MHILYPSPFTIRRARVYILPDLQPLDGDVLMDVMPGTADEVLVVPLKHLAYLDP